MINEPKKANLLEKKTLRGLNTTEISHLLDTATGKSSSDLKKQLKDELVRRLAKNDRRRVIK